MFLNPLNSLRINVFIFIYVFVLFYLSCASAKKNPKKRDWTMWEGHLHQNSKKAMPVVYILRSFDEIWDCQAPLPPSLSLFLVLPHSVTWHRGRGLQLSFSSPTSPTFLQSQPEQASSRAVYASGPTLSIWSVSLSYVHKHTLTLSVETNMIINNTSYSYWINMPTHTSTRVRVQTGLHAAFELSDS